jgi:hypothetical protein
MAMRLVFSSVCVFSYQPIQICLADSPQIVLFEYQNCTESNPTRVEVTATNLGECQIMQASVQDADNK